MGSRLKTEADITRLFECYLEVAMPSSAADQPFVLQKFPDSYACAEVVKSSPQFAYPCHMAVETVSHFSFVLTNIDSKWTFGFCRHAPNSQTCIVILSYLPWHSTFFRVLNHCAELTNCAAKAKYVFTFLEAVYNAQVPQPGLQLSVTYKMEDKLCEFTAYCPDHRKLPSIPQDRNLTEYFNAIDATNMIVIFANMLNERRIIMTSKKLSRLSACVQAANALIYPMHWQHIFIPVLPNHLLDYLSAPMPFLIGVPSGIMNRVKRSELGDIVVLDCDENRIDSPFDDVQVLPTDVVHNLKKSLRTSPKNSMLDDLVARSFLRALVALIGGYRDALRFTPGQKITFNYSAFVSSRPPAVQTFLEKMLELQIFRQFIEGRLEMLNNGEGFSDEFEFELNSYEEKTTHRLKTQYREWSSAMRKEGGAILKNVNPAVRSVYKNVKDKSKQAYKQVKTKMQNNDKAFGDNTQSVADYKAHKPSSAPSSPTLPVKGHIKKSVSGNVIGKTDKTVTYVRQKGLKPNSNSDNQLNGFRKSFSATNNLSVVSSIPSAADRLAPEASPEPSDVESDHSQELLTFDRIEIDLMGELRDYLQKKTSGDESSNSFQSSTSQTSVSSNSVTPTTSVLAKPIPPPRTTNRKAKECGAGGHELTLIELDSPPDDQSKADHNSIIFDPLLEPKTELQSAPALDWNSNNSLKQLDINLRPLALSAPNTSLASVVSPQPVNPFLSFVEQMNSGFVGAQQSMPSPVVSGVRPIVGTSSLPVVANSALSCAPQQPVYDVIGGLKWPAASPSLSPHSNSISAQQSPRMSSQSLMSSQITAKPQLLPKPLTVPSLVGQSLVSNTNSNNNNPFKASNNSWQHFD